MDDIGLKRTLNSIGKSCFIKYFDYFKDDSISKESLIDIISTKERYKKTATLTRINSARRIIKNNLENEAFKIISESSKIDNYTKRTALYKKDKS
jgi:hypothetical protein